MSSKKPVQLTDAELDAIVEWQLDMDEKYNLPFTTNAPRIQDGVQLHHAGDFTSDVINLVSGLVAAREAAAHREALLEARGEVQRRMDDAELADGGKLQTWDALASVIEWIEEKA